MYPPSIAQDVAPWLYAMFILWLLCGGLVLLENNKGERWYTMPSCFILSGLQLICLLKVSGAF